MLKLQLINEPVLENITIHNFPNFPSLAFKNDETGEENHITLLTLVFKSLANIGFSLRNFSFTEFETGNVFIPFEWSQIDIYGEDALGKLEPDKGRLRATREIISIFTSQNLKLSQKELDSDPINPVLEALREKVASFEKLLDTRPNENEVQFFLEKNPIIFAPDLIKCIPHPSFGGKYEPDFILTRPNSYQEVCELIEIESPKHNLFTKSGDATAPLNHAIGQIRDWRQWLRDNARYAQDTLNLTSLNASSKALIVIGRAESLSESSSKALAALNHDFHGETLIMTYDDLLEKNKK